MHNLSILNSFLLICSIIIFLFGIILVVWSLYELEYLVFSSGIFNWSNL